MDLNALIADFFGRPVEPVDVVTLKGDASSRRYHRVVLPDDVTPRTLIVMEIPEDAMHSDEAVSGARPEALPFVDIGRHLAAAGLRVPKIYLDAVDRGALLIEDLGDRLLGDVAADAKEDTVAEWYAAAVDLMSEMHYKMWPLPTGCVAATRRFDYPLLRWELDHYREWGAEALLGSPIAPRLLSRLNEAFDALAAEVDALPKGFVHRDFQSRNIMVLAPRPSAESLAIIDFQDAFEGPRVYDLVALLNDSYVNLPETMKRDLIRRYAEARGIDRGSLEREFDLVTVQRKLKDGGRFVFIDRVKKNPSFLQFVDGSFARVKVALGRIDGHDALKEVLAQVDPERFG